MAVKRHIWPAVKPMTILLPVKIPGKIENRFGGVCSYHNFIQQLFTTSFNSFAMSDSLCQSDIDKFKRYVSLASENSLHYLKNKPNADEVVLKVRLTSKCLKIWYDLKNGGSITISYIQILNSILSNQWGVKITEDCGRLEGRLRRLCSETNSKLKGMSGESYTKLADTVREIKVRESELFKLSEVEKKLQDLNEQNKFLQDENDTLQERCANLYNDLVRANEKEKEMQEKLQTVYADFEKIKNENSHLHEYVSKIEEQQSFHNTGGKITEVKERQQRRKLRELKGAVEKSLWFAKTLGLELETVCLTDEKGDYHKLDFALENPKSWASLSEQEQEKVKAVLFLTDKFCISDSAYHELTMATGGENLPRSYLIKQCKENLNQLCHITRTPGSADGAQLIFEEELTSRIKTQMVNKQIQLGLIKFIIS